MDLARDEKEEVVFCLLAPLIIHIYSSFFLFQSWISIEALQGGITLQRMMCMYVGCLNISLCIYASMVPRAALFLTCIYLFSESGPPELRTCYLS